MAATFGRNRAPTDRYHVEPITTQFHATLLAATVPLKEYLFEQEICAGASDAVAIVRLNGVSV
jgi:hypothetical protein